MIVNVTEKKINADGISKGPSTLEVELGKQCPNTVRIAFAGAQEECKEWIANNPEAHTKLPIPYRFWATSIDDLNGCSNAIYSYDEDGNLENLDTWSCYKLKKARSANKYDWYQMTMFVRWKPKEQDTFIFCTDFLEPVRDGFNRRMSSVDPSDPFTWHALFVDEVRLEYDRCVWAVRDPVREAEKERNKPQSSGPNFPKLHDIARHVIHCVEVLDVAIETLESILHEHDLFISNEVTDKVSNKGSDSVLTTRSDKDHPIQKVQADEVTRRLYYHSRELRAIKARAASLNDRLKNEISLSFNIVSQTDTAAMKIISATLFGMNFFDFSVDENTGKQTFAMSDKFWVYWAIALPVTTAVLLAWVLYDHWYLIAKMLKPLLDSPKLDWVFGRKEKQPDAKSSA